MVSLRNLQFSLTGLEVAGALSFACPAAVWGYIAAAMGRDFVGNAVILVLNRGEFVFSVRY
jgi:hypothetical protein